MARPEFSGPPPLTLQEFLQLEGLVGTGGEAKFRIQHGEVRLNGEVETRRRRKLKAGDVVELFGEQLTVSEQDLPTWQS